MKLLRSLEVRILADVEDEARAETTAVRVDAAIEAALARIAAEWGVKITVYDS